MKKQNITQDDTTTATTATTDTELLTIAWPTKDLLVLKKVYTDLAKAVQRTSNNPDIQIVLINEFGLSNLEAFIKFLVKLGLRSLPQYIQALQNEFTKEARKTGLQYNKSK